MEFANLQVLFANEEARDTLKQIATEKIAKTHAFCLKTRAALELQLGNTEKSRDYQRQAQLCEVQKNYAVKSSS